MEWVPLIIIIAISGICIWKGYERYVAKQRQLEAKIADAVRVLRPIVEKTYAQLTGEIKTRWPLISFDFPTLENLLTKSRTLLAGYPRQDIRRLAKKLLEPIVSKTLADFIAHSPEFVSIGNSTLADTPTSFDTQGDQFQAIPVRYNPPDWATRRKCVYDRDRGRCRRCGTAVPLDKCHIHHIVRRAKGGGHSLDNLVVLCRDCHSLMPEHEKVTGGPFYALPNRYTLHTKECYHAIFARRISGSLPVLIRQGYEPCQKCMPIVHRTLWIERFSRVRLSSIVNSLT
jgi:hypothetical protein